MILANTSNIHPKKSQAVKARPFVKWPGGKKSLTKQLTLFFPKDYTTYYEPFVGGGAVFFEIVDNIHSATLTDINEDLVVAYNQIKDNLDAVIKKLQYHKKNHSEDYYYKIRSQQKLECPLKRTARLIYLNKTCFNGLYRVNRSGEFNVPIGQHKTLNICNVEALRKTSMALQKAHVQVSPFWKTDPPEGSFVYCDPPYHGCFTSYTSDSFNEEQQEILAEKVREWNRKKVKVMVSNSDTSFIRKIYKGFNFNKVVTRRYINCKGSERKEEHELVITNYGRGKSQQTRPRP